VVVLFLQISGTRENASATIVIVMEINVKRPVRHTPKLKALN
jgi:hypothetical protein